MRSSLVNTRTEACRKALRYFTGLSSPSVTDNSAIFSSSPRSQEAGQTRLPTFSMNSRSVASRSTASSAVETWSASRWQAPLVTTACTRRSVCRARRSASFWVCTSPVTTARRRVRPRSARVRSSRAVFPAPGEEIRLNAGTPARASRSRTPAASSSLLAMTRSRTSIVRTAIVDLQVADSQHVARPPLDQRRGAREGRHAEQRLEAERQAAQLDARLLADLEAHRAEERQRLTAQALLRDAADLEGDAHLMHGRAPSAGPRHGPTPRAASPPRPRRRPAARAARRSARWTSPPGPARARPRPCPGGGCRA